MSEIEKITHVAMMRVFESGEIIIRALPQPHRHTALCLVTAKGKQGFLTSKNRFVDREAAKRIARAAYQLKPGRSDGTKLYSEDLIDWPNLPNEETND